MMSSVISSNYNTTLRPFKKNNSNAARKAEKNYSPRELAKSSRTNPIMLSKLSLQNTIENSEVNNPLTSKKTLWKRIRKNLTHHTLPVKLINSNKTYSGIPIYARLPLNEHASINEVSCDFYTPSPPKKIHEHLQIRLSVSLADNHSGANIQAQIIWLNTKNRNLYGGSPKDWYVKITSTKALLNDKNLSKGYELIPAESAGFFVKPKSLLTFYAHTEPDIENKLYTTYCELNSITTNAQCNLNLDNHKCFNNLDFILKTEALKNRNNYPVSSQIWFSNIVVNSDLPLDLSQWHFVTDPNSICGEETIDISTSKPNKTTSLRVQFTKSS